MLSFNRGLGNFQVAVDFLPRRFSGPLALVELFFGLEIMMALNRMDDAKRLALKCAWGINVSKNQEMKQLFMKQLAAYCARTREWSAAVALWEELLTSDLCLEDAIRGLVNVGLAHSLHAMAQGIALVRALKSTRDPATPQKILGNDKTKWDGIERFLEQRKLTLLKLASAELKRDFGLA